MARRHQRSHVLLGASAGHLRQSSGSPVGGTYDNTPSCWWQGCKLTFLSNTLYLFFIHLKCKLINSNNPSYSISLLFIYCVCVFCICTCLCSPRMCAEAREGGWASCCIILQPNLGLGWCIRSSCPCPHPPTSRSSPITVVIDETWPYTAFASDAGNPSSGPRHAQQMSHHHSSNPSSSLQTRVALRGPLSSSSLCLARLVIWRQKFKQWWMSSADVSGILPRKQKSSTGY